MYRRIIIALTLSLSLISCFQKGNFIQNPPYENNLNAPELHVIRAAPDLYTCLNTVNFSINDNVVLSIGSGECARFKWKEGDYIFGITTNPIIGDKQDGAWYSSIQAKINDNNAYYYIISCKESNFNISPSSFNYSEKISKDCTSIK